MSVYKRGNVYWYDFWFRGQRIRQSSGLRNKTAAVRAEAIHKAELAERRAGIARYGRCPTYEDFVNTEFLPLSKKEHEAHPQTHRRYKVSAKPLIQSFGKLPVDAISTGHVEKFKQARASDISPAGTNRDLAALRFMLLLGQRKKFSVHEVLIGRAASVPSNPCPTFRKLGFTDCLSTNSRHLVSDPSGLANALPLEPEVIPIHIPSFVDAHFCLLSRGAETETLQPSK